MIDCDLCVRELQKGEYEGWELIPPGIFCCPNHDHNEIVKIIELTAQKIRQQIIEKITQVEQNKLQTLFEELNLCK